MVSVMRPGSCGAAMSDNGAGPSGWVKFYRVVIEKGWLTNHKLWAFWSYCLLKASHKESVVLVGAEQVPLQPGEFVFGRKRAAADLNMSEKEIRTCIHTVLRRCSLRAIRKASKYSVYSVVNWPIYQGRDDEEGQQEGHLKGQQQGRERAGKGPHTRSKALKKNTYSPDFESFYAAYPLRQGKKKAFDAWRAIDIQNGTFEAILQAIEKQKVHKSYLRERKEFCPEWPLPATWLNGCRWEDEISSDGRPTEDPIEQYKRSKGL